MNHSLVLTSIFILLCLSAKTHSQNILFSEDFESGEIPLSWKNEFVKGSINWRFEPGGYSLNPEIPNSRKPMAPHGGLFNALFQFQSAGNEATKLVTKKIEALEFGIKPELHFFHAQMDWKHGSDFYHDYLRVYYKSSENGPWTLLRSYTEATTGWVERIILLPENDLSGDYYLGFEGETKWGYGSCVDDIQIIETGIQQKYLADISVEQVSEIAVSSGTDNNPVLKLKIKVMGNSGTLPLNSLVLQSLNTSDADIEDGGVKIFFTTDAGFSTDHQVGTGVAFSNGQASFSGLNYDLPTGYSYLWMTYDVKQSAGHRNTIDAKFAPNSININGTTYFNVERSPDGSANIMQTIYSEDFESSTDWVVSGEFEIGSPLGLGGSQGNPDPDYAYSGSKVIGTDLSGIGEYPGDYEKNLNSDEYYAISDTLDFTYYNDLALRYMRFLNIGINDEVFIKVSPDGGLTWKTAWYNSSMILDNTWKLNEVDITSFAARKKKVLIKYSLGSTNDYWQLSGWNIDNVSVTGRFVSRDVGISRIINPTNGCGHTATDSVNVVVKNYGAADSYSVIPLKYSFDGKNTFVYDTLYAIIPFGDSTIFTFKKKIDLSVPDLYSFYVSTSMAGDDDVSNDAIEKLFYIQPTIGTDHIEKFESKGGLWIPSHHEVTNWECGSPGFGIAPPSGTKVWKTRLVTYYPDNDSSFIESACYSNSDGKRKILGVKYWAHAESDFDGAALQYSTDNGVSWNLVDTTDTPWNWYNDTLQATDSRGWSGNSNGWTNAAIILPKNISDAPVVKFRIHFASNESNNGIGLAFDDFTVMVAPHDVGVTAIENLSDACQGINPDSVSVTITNFGVNELRENDTLIAGFDINDQNVIIDTITLSTTVKPGESMLYRFREKADIFEPGAYKITAYTLIEQDPRFYGANNDTAEVEFTVYPNPVTSLPDIIQTHFPDTVILETIYDSEYDYWWNGLPGNSNYHVNDDGWQHLIVTATRGNGCTAYDSTNVELLFNDAGVFDLNHPVDNCGLSTHENPVITIKNFGTDSIYAGQKIALCFSMNDGMPVNDTLVLEQALHSGKTISFTFTGGMADLSQKGIYNFKVFTSYGGDTIATNDTLIRSVEILGRPDVSLGQDITVEALSHTLDAGSGFESYEWDNGLNSQTRTVVESGLYWVRVFDENMCDNYDTAYIRLKIRDISAAGFASPLSACSFETSVPVVLRVINSGTDTIPALSKIAVGYRFMQGERVSDTLVISQELTPGEEISWTFAGTVNLGETGDYVIESTLSLAGDLRTSNDTTIFHIYRYPRPVVDFEMDETEYVEDVSLEMDAGYDADYLYEWHDTAWHESIYTTTTSGLCHVKVTDKRTLCFDQDSVTVFLIYSDVGITWSDLPINGCTGEFANIKVKVSNLGPAVIGSSAPIYVACDVNGTRVVIDTLVRTSNFNAGAVLEMTLSGSIPVNEEGENHIAFYTLFTQDKKHGNDSSTAIYNALPAPEVSFGDVNGNLSVNLPHVLDAGTGNKSYLWQDNSTNQTYTVTQGGIYEVTVTGHNECRTTKTVRVNMQSGSDHAVDERLLIYPNPGNGLFNILMKEQPEEVTVRIFNNQGSMVYIHEFAPNALQHEQIDVQHLIPGIYHLVIQGRGDTYRGKIVVE